MTTEPTEPTEPTEAKLSPDEDGVLRRLFFFEKTGAVLAPSLGVLKGALRARDKRLEVRDPEQTLEQVPPDN